MLNIGPAELMVVLVVALLVLGPNKLPDAARQVGRAIGEMRKLSSGFQAEMRGAMKEPVESKPAAGPVTTKAAKSGGSLSSPRAPAGDPSPVAAGDTPAVAVGDTPTTGEVTDVGSVSADLDGGATTQATPADSPDAGPTRPPPDASHPLSEPGTDGATAT